MSPLGSRTGSCASFYGTGCPAANPTLVTLTRYAEALGKGLQMLLADTASSA